MLVCQREPVVSEERVGAVPESLDELVNHGNGLVVPSSMVGPADVDAQPRPVNGTVPRKGWEALLALTCVSEPVRALVPWCMDNIHAAESTCEATPLEFTLTLLELLLSSRKVDVPPQVVEVDMRDRSVLKDEAIAFYWMKLAAQQNFSLAQRSLGELYEKGSGVAPDIIVASHWYHLAALQGDSIAKQHFQRLGKQISCFKESVNPDKEAP